MRVQQIVCVAITFCCVCSGAVSGATEKELKIKFRTCSLAGEIKDLSYGDLDEPIDLVIPLRQRSEVVRYEGRKRLIFYRKSEQEEGKPIRPAAVVKLREGVRNPLLIFIKRASESGSSQTYDVRVIDDDPRDFRDGSMKFFNLTNLELHLLTGQKRGVKRLVKPGYMADYKLPADFIGNLPVIIGIKKDGKFKKVMSSRIFPEMEVRDIYFISAIPGRKEGNLVRIDTLRERGDVAAMRLRPKE